MKANLKDFFIIFFIFIFFALVSAQAEELMELTKEDATKILIESLKTDKILDLTRYYSRQGSNVLIPEYNDLERYKILEQKGFVILKPIGENGHKEKSFGIVFTEKSEPYLIKKDDGTEDKALISIGKADNFNITALKPVTPKEYKAEILIGYRLNPFGEILLGKQMIFERKEDVFFEHRDGGWKIKLKTSF